MATVNKLGEYVKEPHLGSINEEMSERQIYEIDYSFMILFWMLSTKCLDSICFYRFSNLLFNVCMLVTVGLSVSIRNTEKGFIYLEKRRRSLSLKKCLILLMITICITNCYIVFGDDYDTKRIKRFEEEFAGCWLAIDESQWWEFDNAFFGDQKEAGDEVITTIFSGGNYRHGDIINQLLDEGVYDLSILSEPSVLILENHQGEPCYFTNDGTLMLNSKEYQKVEKGILHEDKYKIMDNTSEETSDVPGEYRGADYEEAYQKIIDCYVEGLEAHWKQQDYEDHGLCYLAGYEESIDNVGFCLMDLNGDTIPELMVGLVQERDVNSEFYDLFTFSDGKASLIVSSGERSRYYLCDDSERIGNSGSSGSALSSYSWGKLGEKDFEIIETVFYDGFYDAENPWFYSNKDAIFEDHSTPISEENALDIINSHVTSDIPYQLLKQIRTVS